ncbi:MAG: glycosyltransferase family 4 protein [Promethearchaeota archaeon]
MIKICFILGSYWDYLKGGSEYQVKILIDYLQKNKNYKIFYIYAGSKCEKTNINGIKVYSLRRYTKKLGNPFFLHSLKILKILNSIQPDVIYQRTGSAYSGISAYYAKRNNCKFIFHISSVSDIKHNKFKCNEIIHPFNFVNRKFLNYGIKNADYIIGQAKYQDEYLYQNYRRHCDIIIPNFHPTPIEISQKKTPIKIVWIANLKKSKQPDIFIKLAELFKEHKNIKFIMAGRCKGGSWHKETLGKIYKSPNIEYLGDISINKVNNILSNSHIFVNTSRFEGFPNTFIQAWMRKVPVVSLHVDPDDIIKKNEIGFHSKDFSQLVRDVKLLIDNKKLREKMGERARKFALRYFSLNNIEKIVELIET